MPQPLILLNGYAATVADWDPTFVEALGASGREVIPLGLRGLGGPPFDGQPFTVADLARDVATALDERGLERAPVLGWSMGGMVAQALALARGDLVGALVLLSTHPGGPHAERAAPAVGAALVDLSGTPHEQATRLLGLLFPPAVAREIDAQFGEIVAAARAQLPHDVARAQAGALEEFHANGVLERLGEIGAPTLVAAGTDDVVVPPSNAELLAAGIRDSWLLRLRGGGHAFMAQYPKPLAHVIDEFLELSTS